MDQMAEIRITFFQECEEQLAALEAGLLTMEEGDTSLETVNAVFRAVHSIKGGAGAFKLDALVGFAHIFETALDKVRAGTLVPDGELMKLLLRAADSLADLVAGARDGDEVDPESYSGLTAEFAALLEFDGAEAEDELDFAVDFTPVVMSFGTPDQDQPQTAVPGRVYKIGFRPLPSLFRNANEPLALLRELALLGDLALECAATDLLPLDLLDPQLPYLSWSGSLTTEADEHTIRGIFEFAEGDCLLSVEEQAKESVSPAPDEESASAVLPVASLVNLVPPQAPAAASPIEVLPKEVASPAAKATSMQPTIRVDLDRVDRLINLVGELVINQAMLSQRVKQSSHVRDAGVATSLDELEHLTRDIQESVMAIRAQPVKPLFQRMSRIVREVADATGKAVRLRTDGEATEVDKTVLELLADPLTHMIRNAVDHGIEKPEDRIAAGKPEEGVIRLSAAHRSGRVVIEVSDDGAGINRPRILQSAIRKGLVPEDAQLTDTEIDNLLFLPGFSTASTISNISGRGVGMDVVKRAIQNLGGRITTASRPGEGSTFTMSLPLTLAVLDGIIVSIGSQSFVIPLTAIVETLKIEPHALHSMGEGTHVIHIRGSLVPLIDVGAELDVRDRIASPHSGVAILVETEKGTRSALLVDGIQDQRQVVIKSLETNYDRVQGVAAATILGDGRVAMILDVDGLVRTRTVDAASADFGSSANPRFARAS